MTTSTAPVETKKTVRSAAQWVTLSYAAVFLLVGWAGFIPGLTTGYDTMEFAGHGSEAMLFGIFQVSVLNNLVHVLYGLAGAALARSATSARHYLFWGGAISLGLWIYGLVVEQSSMANVVPFNTADNWLHLGLGATMIALSFLLRGPRHDRSIP